MSKDIPLSVLKRE